MTVNQHAQHPSALKQKQMESSPHFIVYACATVTCYKVYDLTFLQWNLAFNIFITLFTRSDNIRDLEQGLDERQNQARHYERAPGGPRPAH